MSLVGLCEAKHLANKHTHESAQQARYYSKGDKHCIVANIRTASLAQGRHLSTGKHHAYPRDCSRGACRRVSVVYLQCAASAVGSLNVSLHIYNMLSLNS